MHSDKNIVLTGFMGTGKTTVGKLLANRLGYRFVDTDDLIVERAGRSIPEIFSELGEDVFRQMEAEVARDLAAGQRQVISTGGRMMLDPQNVESLEESGRILCLTAAADEILRRVMADDGHERPLLAGPNPAEKIMQLLEERRKGYGQFQQILTTGKSPEGIVDEVLILLGG